MTGASDARSRRCSMSSSPRPCFVGQVLDDRAHRRSALTVIALDQIVDLGTQSDLEPHRASARQLDRLAGYVSAGSATSSVTLFSSLADRTDVVLLEEADRHLHVRPAALSGHSLARQQRQVEHFGNRFGHVALGNQTQPRQQRESDCLRPDFPRAGGGRGRDRFPSGGPAPTRNTQMRIVEAAFGSGWRRRRCDGSNGYHGFPVSHAAGVAARVSCAGIPAEPARLLWFAIPRRVVACAVVPALLSARHFARDVVRAFRVATGPDRKLFHSCQYGAVHDRRAEPDRAVTWRRHRTSFGSRDAAARSVTGRYSDRRFNPGFPPGPDQLSMKRRLRPIQSTAGTRAGRIR